MSSNITNYSTISRKNKTSRTYVSKQEINKHALLIIMTKIKEVQFTIRVLHILIVHLLMQDYTYYNV